MLYEIKTGKETSYRVMHLHGEYQPVEYTHRNIYIKEAGFGKSIVPLLLSQLTKLYNYNIYNIWCSTRAYVLEYK
jgi:hypothetical protein